MELSTRIKEVRRSLNLTQKQFSEEFHIPQRTVESWESGERKPPVYVVELLEKVVKFIKK